MFLSFKKPPPKQRKKKRSAAELEDEVYSSSPPISNSGTAASTSYFAQNAMSNAGALGSNYSSSNQNGSAMPASVVGTSLSSGYAVSVKRDPVIRTTAFGNKKYQLNEHTFVLDIR